MRRLILVGGVAALLAAPAGAHALATATLSGDVVTDRGVWDYQAIHMVGGDGRDDISFEETLPGLTVHDPGVAIAGVPGDSWLPSGLPAPVCSDDLGTRTCVNAPMTCAGGLGSATCLLSHTNSAATAQLLGITAEGGAGDDRIVIPPIRGATMNYAYGGPGDDDLDAAYVFGGPGADALHGVVFYDDATTGISASDDGVANDGAPGERDNIVVGSSVQGSPFADLIQLAGDGSASAGAGDDSIDVRNGVRNAVQCGSGDDTVTADALDVIADDCEHLA